jgi:hypothetical protein
MKRIDEKVKDIVEVRPYGSVTDFRVDPVLTVTSYHFTDTTADLMSKWIGRAAEVAEGRGEAFALAGYRGVGKSHFLATLSTILGNGELRSRIREPIVEAASRTLQRRQFAIGTVRRGTADTILDELKSGLAPIIGVGPDQLSDNVAEILMQATMNPAGETVVLVVDTALERATRVERNDGGLLTEIATIAKQLGIFVAIALDDDIAGADGENVGIASEYSIDYLDQEHLYKIVDSKIFPKSERMLPTLHEIYQHYRNVIPGFRWSEQRFTSLYPLHPSIMEVAPFVRLYQPEFALLGFASEAGARILGRPANSLIAPDEVFDSVEKGLRSIEELSDVFSAFDRLNSTVVAKTPVMKRLQAKLVLKGLFLFSLNEGGATAAEISGAMLIFDEELPQRAVAEVEGILNAFAAAVPDSIELTQETGEVKRYSFKLTGKDDLRSALSSAALNIGEPETREVIRRVMMERFSDCSFIAQENGELAAESFVVWRGAIRPGLIFWDTNGPERSGNKSDWNIRLDTGAFSGERSTTDDITWRPSPLTNEETLIIKRLAALQQNVQIRNEFKEHVAAAIQAHTVAAEKVLSRSLLIDGVLEIEGLEYNFTEEARASSSLSQISTVMLESWFEGRYPMHPYFPQMLRMREVSSLVSDFFSGKQIALDESQWLASTFAVQLDLAVKTGDKYVPSEGELLSSKPLVQQVMSVLPGDGSTCELDLVFAAISSSPYGLVREAGYLLLSGMASARMLEFVTNTGDRVSRRSFDLKIIWDDIIGVALPATSTYTNARLYWWAGQICGVKVAGGLDSSEVRQSTFKLLTSWLEDWDSADLGGQFETLNDTQLNAQFWRLASISIRSFSLVAESIRAMSQGTVTIETALERIADTFSDSEAVVSARRNEMETVRAFFSTVEIRDAGRLYLSLCEFTGDDTVDGLRSEIEGMLDRYDNGDVSASADELRLKIELFRRSYSELYSGEHDRAVRSRDIKDKVNEIYQTGIWREYQNVVDLTFFDQGYRRSIFEVSRRIDDLNCSFDATVMAQESGACGCRFSLSGAGNIELWPNALWAAVNRGLTDFRDNLTLRKGEILESISNGIDLDDTELVDGARAVRTTLMAGERFGGLTDNEIRILQLADERIRDHRKTPSTESPEISLSGATESWFGTDADIDLMLSNVDDR